MSAVLSHYWVHHENNENGVFVSTHSFFIALWEEVGAFELNSRLVVHNNGHYCMEMSFGAAYDHYGARPRPVTSETLAFPNAALHSATLP